MSCQFPFSNYPKNPKLTFEYCALAARRVTICAAARRTSGGSGGNTSFASAAFASVISMSRGMPEPLSAAAEAAAAAEAPAASTSRQVRYAS